MPFWLFMAPLAVGMALLAVETTAQLRAHLAPQAPGRQAHRAHLKPMTGFLVIGAFLALFMLGFPVVLAIGIPSVVYLVLNGLPLELVAQRTLYALDSFPLVAVPVFLFVGSLMNAAGISKHIYRFADTAVSRLPGGLAQVNIFGSLVFAGMSGSALADIGGIGRIEIDAMRSKGFKPAFASAVTCSSAIVGPIFPPSIPLIIYGTVTGASVIQLLLGGILPGLLCVVMLMLMTAGSPAAQVPARRALADGARAVARLQAGGAGDPAPVILIAGMLAGFFTPTEIAAVTVAYAMLISGVVLPRADLGRRARARRWRRSARRPASC